MLPYLNNDFLVATTRLNFFRKNVFFSCLSFYFIRVLGVFYLFIYFLMAPSLHPPSVQNIPCHHCSSLYTFSDFSRHVKSAHLPASLVSQANQVIFIFANVLPSFASP
jgi:hypothetical protein